MWKDLRGTAEKSHTSIWQMVRSPGAGAFLAKHLPILSTQVGEARPAWKVLRVLGNRLGLPDCEYASSEAIRDELQGLSGTPSAAHGLCELKSLPKAGDVTVSLDDLDTVALLARSPTEQTRDK